MLGFQLITNQGVYRWVVPASHFPKDCVQLIVLVRATRQYQVLFPIFVSAGFAGLDSAKARSLVRCSFECFA